MSSCFFYDGFRYNVVMLRWLTQTVDFPATTSALHEPAGLLAAGGELTVAWLLAAYRQGVFPWFNEASSPILWWSPDPRMVLLPEQLHVPRSLERVLRQQRFHVRYDTAFEAVIRGCAAAPRVGQDGTWIGEKMIAAYIALHEAGYAHSVEAWQGNVLMGGLYGVALGRAFFGESMFARAADASKVAFVTAVRQMRERGMVELIDCQMYTEHLARFGAREMSRVEFERRLSHALATTSNDWIEKMA